MNSNHLNLDARLPSAWACRWLNGISHGSRVLDFASGYGRNTAYALQQGMAVLAVDRDPLAVDSVPSAARRMCTDLEHAPWPFEHEKFAVVIVTNYLFRPRLDLLCSLLAPAGRLIYETFMQGNERYGRPRSRDFLLAPDELLALAQRTGLQVLAFEQGYCEQPLPAMMQRICAQRVGEIGRCVS
jgi:SAM-dependent methyltransferase